MLKALHFHTDGNGLIVVVDSDDTPAHDQSHDDRGFSDPDCRCCELHRILANLRASLAPRPAGLSPLNCAIGIAVPAIEAWYLCDVDQHSTEARFRREEPQNLYRLRRELKQQVYGIVAPPIELSQRKAIEHCQRLAKSLELLERHFPAGFGTLARDLRRWR
jgi:hypothetical protein